MMAAVLRYELDKYATQLPLHADEQEWRVASTKSSYPFPLLKEAHESKLWVSNAVAITLCCMVNMYEGFTALCRLVMFK